MTVLGEGKAPAKTDIYKIGEKHGIKKKTVGLIVDKVSEAVTNLQTYAQTAGVSKTTLKKINAKIKNNLDEFSRF